MQTIWPDIEQALHNAGIDISKIADVTGAEIYEGTQKVGQVPGRDNPNKGTFSIDNNNFAVVGHDGRTRVGDLKDAGGDIVRMTLEELGLKDGGGVPFSRNQTTDPRHRRELSKVYGVESWRTVSPHFQQDPSGKWVESSSVMNSQSRNR